MSSFRDHGLREKLGENLYLDSVFIPSGSFWMGSPKEEVMRGKDESPLHKVRISSFWMSKYPITQAQWQFVKELPQIKRALGGGSLCLKEDNLPVEGISWGDAVEFCDRLSEYTGRAYRLPTEAEWEYACRAGTSDPFYFGKTITTDLANYDGKYSYNSQSIGIYREHTVKVGSFPPNAFGLYDMHGNVSEWCLDHWHENYYGAPTDGRAWVTGGVSGLRIRRGGSWHSFPWACRSAHRDWGKLYFGYTYTGFRVVVPSFKTVNPCAYF